jgi:hypothetical protein
MRENRMSGSMSGDWKRGPIKGLPRQSSTLRGCLGALELSGKSAQVAILRRSRPTYCTMPSVTMSRPVAGTDTIDGT